MRIAYVGAVPPLQGGISQHGGRLVDELRRQGHTVSVRSWRSQYPSLLYPGESQWIPGEREPVEGVHTLRWWNPVGWWRVGREIRSYDLIVMPWVTPLQAPALRVIQRASGDVPVVLDVHNPLPHEGQPFAERLARWFLPNIDGVLTHSAAASTGIRELAPGLPTAVCALPPLIRVEPESMPELPPLRLLFFGFIRPYKGLSTLLDALLVLADRMDARLTIAGQVWGSARFLEEEIAARHLDSVVDVRSGYVADADVERLFASHHVVVLPYRNATQSGIVPLSHSAGRPVVATEVGALPEQVSAPAGGRVAPPDDPRAFARAIMDVSREIESYPDRALTCVPSWTDVVEALLDIVDLDRG